MTNGEKTAVLFGCMFFVFLALGSATVGVIGGTNGKARAKLANSEKWKSRTEENQKQYVETQARVEKEKVEIREKITEYLQSDSSSWEKLGSGDSDEMYKNAEIVKKQTEVILADISNISWGNTGDIKFDKECEELKEKMIEAYTARHELTVKLLALQNDINSAEKADDARESIENAGEIWKEYLSELSEFIKK